MSTCLYLSFSSTFQFDNLTFTHSLSLSLVRFIPPCWFLFLVWGDEMKFLLPLWIFECENVCALVIDFHSLVNLMVIINSLCVSVIYSRRHLIDNPGVHLKRFLPLDCRQFVPIFITPLRSSQREKEGIFNKYKNLQPFFICCFLKSIKNASLAQLFEQVKFKIW